MSTRSVRMCDLVEQSEVCSRPFSYVCPICDRDVCTYHVGGEFGSAISVGSVSDKRKLANHGVSVCDACNSALGAFIGNQQRKEFVAIATSIMSTLIESARAILAEKKLVESK